MADFNFKGMDKYLLELEKVNKASKGAIGSAIYQGAKVVADEFRKAIDDLPIDNRRRPETRTGVKTIEKVGLQDGLGIAPLKNENNFINVKIGFSGYISDGNGWDVPVTKVARSIESGTSFMPKYQTFSKAAKRSKKACEKAMALAFDETIHAIKDKE